MITSNARWNATAAYRRGYALVLAKKSRRGYALMYLMQVPRHIPDGWQTVPRKQSLPLDIDPPVVV